ncbi:MAG: tRNA (adenosine(37)-N6)-threonylcarbamoyltransferase complex dimerization subunit type 1 TsaB, partial [Mycobacterium sp.]
MSGAPGTLVLAIDTATPAVTAGVVRRRGDRLDVLAERVSVDARGHAERITPNVLGALTDAGLTMNELDAVVVGCGPGPFTGLRVGMTTAAAYGHALDIPVYGVCSLDAIGGQTTGETLVVTDARRREVYWARYSDGMRTGGPGVNAPADVDPGAARTVAGSPEHAALFELARCDRAYPTPVGLVAAVTMRAGTGPGWGSPRLRGRAAVSTHAVADWAQPPAALVPLYLRRPDAKTLTERHVTFGALTVADARR